MQHAGGNTARHTQQQTSGKTALLATRPRKKPPSDRKARRQRSEEREKRRRADEEERSAQGGGRGGEGAARSEEQGGPAEQLLHPIAPGAGAPGGGLDACGRNVVSSSSPAGSLLRLSLASRRELTQVPRAGHCILRAARGVPWSAGGQELRHSALHIGHLPRPEL
ncbi:unnamed protein product [Prorocentrum cordatum]|uniref:Uncharacterized protein n=1 Tax=Prorocentrum cordatum TaxID=2364126 RepID=A0ABN9U4V4_9DINO|nr:unnamed protein product [Polarella glacialis]